MCLLLVWVLWYFHMAMAKFQITLRSELSPKFLMSLGFTAVTKSPA